MPTSLDRLPKATKEEILEALRSLDTNGNRKLDRSEVPALIKEVHEDIKHFAHRYQGRCATAGKLALSGVLPDWVLKKVAEMQEAGALKEVRRYLDSDLANTAFPNGIAEVTAADVKPIVDWAVETAKTCARTPGHKL